jgi:methylated-DNA-[protein]-cysteine S-methyltransferase
MNNRHEQATPPIGGQDEGKAAMNGAVAASFCVFDTAFGVCAVAWTEAGLATVRLPDRDEADLPDTLSTNGLIEAEPVAAIRPVIDALVRYFLGNHEIFVDVPLDVARISPFNRRVYDRLRLVPRGRTTTYGSLARAVGQPSATQAVGRAMAANPWPVIVPCHRVLGTRENFGGFSAPGGQATKARLLAHEGIAGIHQPSLPGLD